MRWKKSTNIYKRSRKKENKLIVVYFSGIKKIMSEFEARYKTWRKKNQCIPIIFSLRVIKGVQAKQKERKKNNWRQHWNWKSNGNEHLSSAKSACNERRQINHSVAVRQIDISFRGTVPALISCLNGTNSHIFSPYSMNERRKMLGISETWHREDGAKQRLLETYFIPPTTPKTWNKKKKGQQQTFLPCETPSKLISRRCNSLSERIQSLSICVD